MHTLFLFEQGSIVISHVCWLVSSLVGLFVNIQPLAHPCSGAAGVVDRQRWQTVFGEYIWGIFSSAYSTYRVLVICTAIGWQLFACWRNLFPSTFWLHFDIF